MEVVNIRDQSPGERVVEEEVTWENPGDVEVVGRKETRLGKLKRYVQGGPKFDQR